MHKTVEVFNFTVLTHSQIKSSVKRFHIHGTMQRNTNLNYCDNRKVPAARNKSLSFAQAQT